MVQKWTSSGQDLNRTEIKHDVSVKRKRMRERTGSDKRKKGRGEEGEEGGQVWVCEEEVETGRREEEERKPN